MKTWTYGVTTIPQRLDLLQRTLASLKAGGFDRPHLFVDAYEDRYWPDYQRLIDEGKASNVTVRPCRVKTVGNWVLGLVELYFLNPAVSFYAMFQDDLITSQNLRIYIERSPGPHNTPNIKSYLNLYTAPKNETSPLCPRTPKDRMSTLKRPMEGVRNVAFDPNFIGYYPGIYSRPWLTLGTIPKDRIGNSLQAGLGAVALVFNRLGVQTLLSSMSLVLKPTNPHRGHVALDGAIVTAMNGNSWTEYVHYPSLVQHTGEISSMANPKHLPSETFLGENYNLMDLLK